jgi:hypothetical protein
VLRLTAAEFADARSADSAARAALASLASVVRSIPAFFRATPATPLRVLCIIALETIHLRRQSSAFTRRRREELAILLDFQACMNAAWDDKPHRPSEWQALRKRLEAGGLGMWVGEYLERLRQLETGRPTIGGGVQHFDRVREYREAVVRLSLATVAGVALNIRHVDEAIVATNADGDLAALVDLAMQCQVIDDVLDYRQDAASGLPSFITAAPLQQALASAAGVVQAHGRDRTSTRAMFPFRWARSVLTVVAAASVRAAGWIHDARLWKPIVQRDSKAPTEMDA